MTGENKAGQAINKITRMALDEGSTDKEIDLKDTGLDPNKTLPIS